MNLAPTDAGLNHRLAQSPIAIVGLASLFPGARNQREFWRNIVNGTDCIQDVPEGHWSTEDYYDPDPTAEDKTYCRRGGFVPEVAFSPLEFGLPPTTLEVTDILQLLSLVVARDLLRDAGCDEAGWYDSRRTGAIFGVTGSNSLVQPLIARLQTPVLKEVMRSCGISSADAEAVAAKFTKKFIPWEENSFPGMLGNLVAGRVANRFNLGGANCTVDAACASSLAAIKMSISELIEGRSDLMLSGGCDAENTIFMYMCFSKTPAFSKSGQIRPFDADADGTLIGEGIGMLALRRLADAERDGNRIYAVIRGIGTASDGRFKSIYAPRAEGQVTCLERAYADAECSPGSIELLEAHGTGTAVGDKTELTALGMVFGEATDELQFAAVGSVKSQIGHTKAAAGAASMIKVALSLHDKVLPPTINVSTPNPAIDFARTAFYVNTETRPWIRHPLRPRRGAVSAFGFGGTDFHVVLEEYAGGQRPPTVLHPVAQAWIWQAADAESLAAALEAGADAADDGAIPADHARIGFVAGAEDYPELLQLARAQLRAQTADAWAHPRGIFYRRRAAAPGTRTAALFVGQGSQYVNMGREAVLNIPPVRMAFDDANQQYADAEPLSRVVFPIPVAGADSPDREVPDREEKLRRTEYAQPAICTLAAGQYGFLAGLGFQPDGFLGHSLGELTALWAAGCFTGEELFRLARARGSAMSRPPGEGGDAGSIAAVNAPEARVRQLLAGTDSVGDDALSICNYNAPDQLAVGGATPAVDALLARCAAAGVDARRLAVSAAFHTSFVRHAVEPFRAAVNGVEFRAPARPVYANTSGAAYGDDPAENRRILAEQLVNPVHFAAQVQAMYRDGFRVFVEFGPKRVLSRLVTATLSNHDDVLVCAADGGPDRDSDVCLKQAAVQLAVLGLPVHRINRYAEPADAGPGPSQLTMPLTGVNYVSPQRQAAYQAGLDDGYRASLPAAEPRSLPPSEVGQPMHAEQREIVEREIVRPEIVRPEIVRPAAARSRPAEAPAHVPAAPAAGNGHAPAGNGRAPAGSSAVEELLTTAKQHLDLHAEYLSGQLHTGEYLTELVERHDRDGTTDDIRSIVDAVTEHGLILGRTHTRASEILRDLVQYQPGRAVGYPAAAPRGDGQPTPPPVAPPPETPPAIPYPASPPSADRRPDEARRAPAVPATDLPVAPLVPDPPAPVAVPPAAPNGQPRGLDPASVEAELLAIVASKTGYPADMLDAGMLMESDLGIDSIKRVEILGVLRERYPQAVEIGPEQLAELQTLADIVILIAGAAPATAPAAGNGRVGGPDRSTVESELLAIVAGKTGYPADMLDVEMLMESDLGIDSIKRVEILGVLRERYPQAVEIGPEQLAELQTLADIVTLIAGAAPATAAGPAAAGPAAAVPAAAGPAAAAPVTSVATPVSEEAVGVARRYPTLSALPAVDRQVGVYTAEPVAIVVDDGSQLCPSVADALAAEGWQIAVLRLPGAAPRRYPYRVFDLTSWDEEELADAEAALTGVTQVELCLYVAAHEPATWTEATDRLAHAVMLAKHVQPPLLLAAGQTRAAFVVAAKLNGAQRPGGGTNPAALLGGLHGLVKTFAIEAPQLFCRAVDLAPGLDDAVAAGLVVDEIYDVAAEPLQVVLDGTDRYTIGLTDAAPPALGSTPPELAPDDLLVVTGGGRGVTALCMQALMRQGPCRLVLLGRTALAEEPEWAVLAAGESAVKAAAADHLRGSGQKPTPREVDRLTRDLLAGREVLATLADLREAGADAAYLPVDIADEQAVAAALAPFADQVTGIVHGAGVLADHLIFAKTPDEVRRVFAAKLAGLRNVLATLDPERLRHLVLFSSVAGFFGNEGQVDYAMANSALSAVAADWKVRYPGCHATAINWGAWAGGMVTPQLQALFAERGVGLIPLDVGARMFAEQFTGEHLSDVVAVVAPLTPLSARTGRQPGDGVLVVERSLSEMDTEPVVRDHRIGGVPVLPTTVALGWCVNTLERLYPGRSVTGARDFTVFKGVIFGASDPGSYQLRATPLAPYDGSAVEVVVRGGGGPGGISPRYGGTFSLAAPAPAGSVELGSVAGADVGGPSPYADGTLFHGPALQGITRTLGQDETRLVIECRLDRTGLARGAYHGDRYDPVLSDLLLQAPLVWVRRFRDSACLPVSIGRVELHDRPPAGSTFLVLVDQIVTSGPIVTCSVTACAADGRVYQRFGDVSVALSQSLSERFEQRGLSDVRH